MPKTQRKRHVVVRERQHHLDGPSRKACLQRVQFKNEKGREKRRERQKRHREFEARPCQHNIPPLLHPAAFRCLVRNRF